MIDCLFMLYVQLDYIIFTRNREHTFKLSRLLLRDVDLREVFRDDALCSFSIALKHYE